MKYRQCGFLAFAVALVLVYSSIAAAEGGQARKYTRVLAKVTDEKGIGELAGKGCLLRHKLKGETSYDCPSDIVGQLNVRKAMVYQLMDLNADKQIEADRVWAAGVTGDPVTVAILDTGIDTDHPELADSYAGGYDFVNDVPVPEDDNGHGTHVAGIITSNGAVNGNSKGVGPAVRVLMYKVCNWSQSAGGYYCMEDDMLAGMDAVKASGANIMSMSIGGGSYTTADCDVGDALAAKVNELAASGILPVIAAGNDGKGVSSPGCASGAVAVGAVDSADAVAYFSGRGPALDVVAPGVNIYSLYLSGGYTAMSGTSMATPHVAAVAALISSANPALTSEGIRSILYTTTTPASKCVKCTWRGTTCWKTSAVTCNAGMTGAGVVDAYNAYLKATGAAPPVKCWSGANTYLQNDASQLRKFCKCAQGTYGYQSASGAAKKNAYRYSDAADNLNWATASVSKVSAVTSATCADGKQYSAGQDQYHAG